jgi:hypothetical protein
MRSGANIDKINAPFLFGDKATAAPASIARLRAAGSSCTRAALM